MYRTIEQNQRVMATVQDQEVVTEAERRIRQAQFALKCWLMAEAKLNQIKVEDLTIKQAIELAKLGLSEERKALGFADKYEVTNVQEMPTEEYITVEERKLRIKQTGNLASQLLEYLNSHPSAIDCK